LDWPGIEPSGVRDEMPTVMVSQLSSVTETNCNVIVVVVAGDFGPYQLRQSLLHMLTALTAGLHMLTLVTVAAVPDHRLDINKYYGACKYVEWLSENFCRRQI